MRSMPAASIQALLRAVRAGADPTAAIDALLERGYSMDRARRACGLRILCQYCKSEIDPDVCHCGTLTNEHTFYDGHSPVPMGCICHQLDDATHSEAVLRAAGIVPDELHAALMDE